MKKLLFGIAIVTISSGASFSLADSSNQGWNSSKGVLTLSDVGAKLSNKIEANVSIDMDTVTAVYEKKGSYTLESGCIESVQFSENGFPYQATFKLALPEFVAKEAKAPRGSTAILMKIAIFEASVAKDSWNFAHALTAASYIDINGKILNDDFYGSANRRLVTNQNLVKQLLAMGKVGPFCK